MTHSPRRRRFILVGLLGAALASWTAGCGGQGNDDVGGTSEGGATAARPAASPVTDFREFAARAQGNADGPLEAATIAEGLRALAGALGTLAAAPPELLVDLRVTAEHVLLDPESVEVAATVQQSLVTAASALSGEGAKGTAVQQAAAAIRPDMPLTEQPAAVRAFFREAANAMSGAGQDGA